MRIPQTCGFPKYEKPRSDCTALANETSKPRDIPIYACEHSFVMNSLSLLRSLVLNSLIFVFYCT